MFDFERVHTMTDYYDGPRGGIADYLGQPHLYESQFEDSTGFQDTFRLSPVDADAFEWALEDWQIWLRWETAFHSQQTAHETHPALPKDRPRHEQLTRLLENRLVINDNDCIIRLGEFRPRDDPKWSGMGFRPLEVRWTEPNVKDD